MTHIISQIPWILAETGASSPDFVTQLLSALGENLGDSLLDLGKALLILVIGWLVAGIAKGIVVGILNRTEIDNKIVSWISGDDGDDSIPIEQWAGETVYWLVLLFAIVAFLNALELEAVSEPLNGLLNQVTSFLPQIGAAAVLLGVAWLLATLTKIVLERALKALRIDERLNQQMGETDSQNQFLLSDTIANALYWFIFLLFLPSILSTLELEGTLVPLQNLVDNILAMLPNILGAVIIGAIGWVVAQLVKRIVTNLLAATGVNAIGEKFGLSAGAEGQSLAQIIGGIVYVLILIPISIAALDALQIQAISEPAINMLEQVVNILPKIFAATAILILAYVAGKYIGELVTNILTSVGFNNIYRWLGVSLPSSEGETKKESGQTPSEIIGTLALTAIMLVAALTAVDILEIEALTGVVQVILVIAGQVLVGLIVFAVGLFLANKAFELISSTKTRQSNILAQTARIAIITLTSAMALQQMGIAPNIVNLAFGLLVGGIAVAISIAFGLGAKDIAGEQLKEWLDSFKQD